MRTTVRLDSALFEQVKREAARRGQTVASMVEAGLRLVLEQSKPATGRSSVALPACQAGGGPLPGVDLNDSAALLDAMEGRPERKCW